jgi:lycopene beta-cyclase
MANIIRCDLAVVGGGLAGSLIALALHRARPDLELRLIEAGPRLGGNHLWSFFVGDIDAADRWMVDPLIVHRWPRHRVRFPAHHRMIGQAYHSIESARLDRIVQERLPAHRIMTGARVAAVGSTSVELSNGDRIEAGGVIDCRGPGNTGLLDLGWQKFIGQELELGAPHDQPDPVIMDATVPQIDGYRFVYCLPFSPTTMFVEDTYYSDTPDLDLTPLDDRPGANGDPLMPRIADYAAAQGWQVERVARTEKGALPVAMGGDFEGYWRSGGAGVAKGGMRAGLFHPLTGYSLPDSVRLAALIARTSDLSGPALHELTLGYARSVWKARGFYRMLTKMLFRAADPGERYRVMERFYRLNPVLIGRFYAGQSTLFDKARILTGKPPVPIGRAIAAIRE